MAEYVGEDTCGVPGFSVTLKQVEGDTDRYRVTVAHREKGYCTEWSTECKGLREILKLTLPQLNGKSVGGYWEGTCYEEVVRASEVTNQDLCAEDACKFASALVDHLNAAGDAPLSGPSIVAWLESPAGSLPLAHSLRMPTAAEAMRGTAGAHLSAQITADLKKCENVFDQIAAAIRYAVGQGLDHVQLVVEDKLTNHDRQTIQDILTYYFGYSSARCLTHPFLSSEDTCIYICWSCGPYRMRCSKPAK